MEVLRFAPDGALASILILLPTQTCIGILSLVCQNWNRVLRDVVHSTMTRTITLSRVASDVVLVAITARCPSITSLHLSDCCHVCDVGVYATAAGCPSITNLNLASCQQVTDIGVRAIAAGCPGITSLNLARCRQVSDVGVQAIGAGCPNLTSFDL